MDLNIIWFVLITVLFIGYAVLDGFDLGIGAIYLSFKKEDERQILLKSIGPFWDGNEVWLVAAGGALFAAFPGAYASIFSGFYIPLMLLLVGIIFRAIAIEFRNKEEGKNWRQRWDVAFTVASIIILFVLGVAVGNLWLQIPVDAKGNIIIGFFELFTPLPILVSLFSIFFFATHGAIYAAMKTGGELNETLRKNVIIYLTIAAIVFILLFIITSFDILPVIKQNPELFIAINALIVALFWGIRVLIKKNKIGKAFILSSSIIALYIINLAINIFPNWIISSIHTNNNLTIYNTASSTNTLEIMLIIAAIGMPIVIAYTIGVYRIFRGKIQ